MAYTVNSASDSRGDEHTFVRRFEQNQGAILAYKQQHGGDLEGAYRAVTGESWPAGRSVKIRNGRAEMTKDRTVKSVLGKYVAPIAGAVAAPFALPALFGGAGAAAAPAAAKGGFGMSGALKLLATAPLLVSALRGTGGGGQPDLSTEAGLGEMLDLKKQQARRQDPLRQALTQLAMNLLPRSAFGALPGREEID
mgnify:CR=1 FL=1